MADAPSLGKLSTPQATGRQMFSRGERQQRRNQGIRGGSSGSVYSEPESNEYDDYLARFGGGGESDFGRILQYLMSLPPPENRSDVIRTRAQVNDPEGYARRQYNAQTYAAPFAEGGLFQGRRAQDIMSPEQILASQGNTAANQWAQLGAGGDEQRRANMARRMFGSGRAYYG